MVAPSTHAQVGPPPVGAPDVVLCVRDAATGDEVTRASVRVDDGVPRRLEGACRLIALSAEQTVHVRRLGYQPWSGRRPADGDTLRVLLVPLAAMLPPSVTRGDGTSAAPMATRRTVDEARSVGVASSGALVALLPYTQPRSARGETSVSLRGARREQVAITLDGLPLTDPGTGVADVADIPLAALASATVAPGSDPLGAGPGAIGGVLALQSGQGRVLALRTGAFGAGSVEAATDVAFGAQRVRVGVARSVARNDFAFVNDASTTGRRFVERRVNNDVARHSLFASWTGMRTQLTLLGAETRQGLVGPVNVRDNDEDRASARRLLVRASTDVHGLLLGTGVRAFTLGYRDPARPQFDTEAHVIAAEVDARRTLRGLLWHAGVGVDRLRTSAGLAQARERAWLSAARAFDAIGLRWQGGARLDAVTGNSRAAAGGAGGDGAGTWPSLSLAVERPLGGTSRAATVVGARAAQALRVPTLYDLYFSSPQRLTVRTLQPERVLLDAELFVRWRPTPAHGANAKGTLAVDAALVSRASRDAIVWFPGNFGWSPANVGREAVHGLELRAEWQRQRWLGSAWVTHYRAELTSGTLRIPTPYVPETAAGAVARAPLMATPLGAVEGSLVGRWMGSRPYTAGPRDPFFRLPPVAVLDAALSLRRRAVHADWLVTAALDNATDRAWQSVRGFPSPGRSWSVALTITP
jgi:hypothetical protein